MLSAICDIQPLDVSCWTSLQGKEVSPEDKLFQEFSVLYPDLRSLKVSLCAKVSGIKVAQNDAIMIRSAGGTLLLLAECFVGFDNGVAMVVGRCCIETSKMRTACVCNIDTAYSYAYIDHIVKRCAYAPHDNGAILVLDMKNPSLPP